MVITKGSGTQACIKYDWLRQKEIVTMTTTGPCEMSGLSPKSSGVGSKFLCFICLIVQAQFVYRGWFKEEEEGVIPLSSQPRKSFVMLIFQQSVSNLLHNVFCSFPNSFPKVSVIIRFTDRVRTAMSKSLLEAGWKPKFVGQRLCVIFLGPGTVEGLKKC